MICNLTWEDSLQSSFNYVAGLRGTTGAKSLAIS